MTWIERTYREMAARLLEMPPERLAVVSLPDGDQPGCLVWTRPNGDPNRRLYLNWTQLSSVTPLSGIIPRLS